MGFLASGKAGLGDEGKIGLAAAGLAWLTRPSGSAGPTVKTMRNSEMKHTRLIFALLLAALLSSAAAGQILGPTTEGAPVIVRDSLGITGLRTTCLLLGCKVNGQIDGSLGLVFLITSPSGVRLDIFLQTLLGQTGIVDAEPDLILRVAQSQPLPAPSGLWDTTPVSYYGTTVWEGYATQPAVNIINLPGFQSQQNPSSTGSGVVGVIDTGVDPGHPALQGALLQGYDFTRNQTAGSELGDVSQSTMAVVNGAAPAQVNQSTMAVVNQQGSSTFSQSQYAAFGHGTMVAGVIHLVAPGAQIMPLKSFRADGTGSLSNVLRAIYYATQNGADILNMSFAFSSYSQELASAVNYATRKGVVCIASVGNDGQQEMVYPAGLNNVIGVASTSNGDTLSSFSNYGQPPVWIAAPGEGIITTYPYGTYAAGWGTSFSAPFVTGTVALLRGLSANINQSSAASAISHAVYISPALGNGRLDVIQATTAWCQAGQQC
jgi:subtilisin family serine protease